MFHERARSVLYADGGGFHFAPKFAPTDKSAARRVAFLGAPLGKFVGPVRAGLHFQNRGLRLREPATGNSRWQSLRPTQKLACAPLPSDLRQKKAVAPRYDVRSGCCARVASGHAAAPPMSVMNLRRFTAPVPRKR